ncbi:MAG TPA: PQQ-binding-like beta-propeller repeat protein [Planctomycetota bacterium]|nr:PQQ-binding-like beta-propeller repeat protein [Planctomycetota bacterium]
MKLAYSAILLVLFAAAAADAEEKQFDVTLQLVKADAPHETVDAGSLDETAGHWPGNAAIVWPKNIKLDGQPMFERYFQGRLAARQASVKPPLKPGRHTFWPGDHSFEVDENGKVSSNDPEIIAADGVVKLKCYAVMLAAYQVNSPESSMNVDLRLVPTKQLSIGIDVPAERKPDDKEGAPLRMVFVDFLPIYSEFKPVTIYLPASADGKPYSVRPGKFNLDIKPEGLSVGGQKLGDLLIRKHRLYVPFRSYPVVGRTLAGRVCQAVFPSGGSFGVGAGGGDGRSPVIEDETIRGGVLSRTQHVSLTASTEAHQFGAGNKLSPEGRYVDVEGSLGEWPEKAFCYDNTAAESEEPRLLLVERKAEPLKVGEPVPVRVRWVDAPDAATLKESEAVFFLQPMNLQGQPGNKWRQLSSAASGDYVVNVTVPADVKPGVFILRTSVCEKGHADPMSTLSADAIVGVVDPEAGGSVSIFTQKARDAFVCGEDFYLGVAIKTVKAIPAGSTVELEVSDPFGQKWTLGREKTPNEIKSADSMHFWLKGDLTSRLAPGRYTVTARLAKLTPGELAFDLVTREKSTNFINLLHGKYSSIETWLGRLETSRDGQWTSELLASELADLGINRVILTQMGSPIGRYYRHEPERRLEDLYRNSPTLPHWQSIYFPTGRERLLNSFLRHGIDFVLDLFSYEDDGQPTHLPHIIGSQRYTALQMQAMRHNPANLGFCAFNERYSSPGSNWPQGMLEVHMQALQERFLQEYGISTGEALRVKERFLNRPPNLRKPADLDKFRPAGTWSDFQYDHFVRRTSDAANKTTDGLVNTTILRSFAGIGGYVVACGYPATMYESLQWSTTLQYKDGFGFGSAVLFTAQMADILKVRDDIENVPAICVWGSGLQNVQIYTKHLFSGLSQCVDGMATFCFNHDFQSGGGDARSDRDTLQDVYRDILTPYGDWLKSLDRGYRQIAVYYSRQAEMLSSAKTIAPDKQAEGTWIACLRAGFPADYVMDEQLLSGAGERYKVIVVPGFSVENETPENIRAELERLVRKGVVVLVDRRSKLDLVIDGIKKLDHNLDRFSLYTHAAFWFPNHWDADWILVEKMTRDLAALLRKELPKYIQPAAEADLIISPDWLQRGEMSLMVVPNFEHPDFSYEHIEQFHKPFVKKITFPTNTTPRRGKVCYDVLENKLVPVEELGDKAAIVADVRHYGGKMYAFLPAQIGGVSIKANSAAAAGESVGYRVEVLDAAGRAFDASLPLRIDVIDASGKTLKTQYRAAAPQYKGVWVPGLNAPSGVWKIRATELVSGTCAEAAVRVGEPGFPEPLKADTTAVWTADVKHIREFMKSRKEILIPLESGQQWARPEAERLAKGLNAKGVRARVVEADDAIRPVGNNVLDCYHSWRAETYPPPMVVAAYDGRDPDEPQKERPVIAIGKRWESRLIEALLSYSVLADVPSELHPGPGKALVQYVWNAYSVYDDLVCVSVSDDAGLKRAVDWLLNIPENETGRTYKPKIAQPPAPKAELAAGTAAEPQKRSFRAIYSREDEIRAMAHDPATGRILVGTKGWGHNLFCLDSAGKKLWSVYLPEHNVHRVSFSPDGKRVIAGVGMPARIYVLDDSGNVQFCFHASEYPNFRFRNTDEMYGFEFIVNHQNGDIYAFGKTGVMAVSLDGRRRWFLDRWEASQLIEREVIQQGSMGIEFGRELKSVRLSPDGRFIATTEEIKEATTEVERGGGPVLLPISRNEVVIYSTEDLKQVASYEDKRLCIMPEIFPRLFWSKDSSTVTLRRLVPYVVLSVTGEMKSVNVAPVVRQPLELHGENRSVRAFDGAGRRLWTREALPMIGSCASPDLKQAYVLDSYGIIHCVNAATGADLWARETGNKGILQTLPDGDVLFGGLNGMVARFAPNGDRRWTSMLRDMHEIAGDYDKFAADAKVGLKDISTELYPSMVDKEGDLDSLLRFGNDVVVNGSFEDDSRWQMPSERGGFTEGRTGKRAAQTAGGTITQPLECTVVPLATYLLEFYYKPRDWSDSLTAGVLVQGPREVLTGRQFSGTPGQWNFARMAVKVFSDTTGLTVGFEAVSGTVAIDDVRLRPVRFPSKNFLFSAQAHALKPRFVDDLSSTQRGVPRSVEANLIKQDHVSWYVPGGMIGSRGESLESMALLQNGQLDDVGKMWHTQPDPLGLNIGMRQARYVSHVVVYFSHLYPGEVWPRFQIKVNDVSIKNYVNVASVRGNCRTFCVVKFEPVLTDLIFILPVGGITQWDATITEIEVYGPLGGPEAVHGWPGDADAVPMYMSTPSHVRPVAKLDIENAQVLQFDAWNTAHDTGAGAVVADGKLYLASSDGQVSSCTLGENNKLNVAERGGTGSLAITGTPALYSARLFAPSADGSLYCLASGDCSLQWKFQSGGRMLSSPVADGDDVYAGSDDGMLHKLDVESGMLLWSFDAKARIRTSPALDDGRIFFVSWDGQCHAVSKEDAKPLWKSAVAPYTTSSPVAAAGKVFVGDESGFGHCFDAGSGQPVWKVQAGNRISTPPTFIGQSIVFAADDGSVVCVALSDGSELWRYKAPGGVKVAPVPTTAGLIVAGRSGIDVVDPATGAKIRGFDIRNAFDVLPYKGMLFVITEGKVAVIAAKK